MRKNFLYHILLTAAITLVSVNISFAQLTCLMQGKVTDEISGKPVGAKYEILSPSGEKIQGKSNAKTGEYQAILAPGTRYTINFSGYDILRKSETFSTAPANEYSEQSHNFTVRKLTTGMSLFAVNGFQPNMTELSSEAKAKLDNIKAMMKDNRLMTLSVAVNVADTKFAPPVQPKPAKPTKQKGKKGKVVVEAPASPPAPVGPSQEEVLANARLEAVKNYLSDVKNAEMRIKFTTDANDKSAQNNLMVNIGEVKDMFE